MRAEFIVKEAKKLRDSFLKSDCCSLEDQIGVLVKYKDLGSLKGAYFGNMKTPVIVINSELNERTQEIVFAHELGHHILHKGALLSCETPDLQNSSILEREANIFAAAFLIDTEKALSLLHEEKTVYETASILETDCNLLMFLLNALNIAQAPDSTFLK